MHIAVCDDSAFDRELIVELLHIYFAQKPFQYKLAQYNSGINLVCDVEDGCWFDIIFLDIYMNGLLGIDAAHKLRALGFDGAIIFLTASADFAVDSYDVAAAGYLLKPHSFDKSCAGVWTASFRILIPARTRYSSGCESSVYRIPRSRS